MNTATAIAANPNRFSNLVEAFPDYDISTLPTIPAGWIDISFHQEVCPAFKTENGLHVFVDFKDTEQREFGEDLERFSVFHNGENYRSSNPQGRLDCLFWTDNWEAVLAFVRRYMTLPTVLVQTLEDGTSIKSTFHDGNIFDAFPIRNYEHTGFLTRKGVREELHLRPTFKGIAGPMWGIDHIRYECATTYKSLSQ